MKSRYLLSAGAALAVALGGAQANAQFAFLGGPYPVAYYIGPEGGWTSLSDQKDTVATLPFTVNNGPALNAFQFNTKYDSGFNVGARAGIQWGPMRVEEEYSYRHNGLSNFGGASTGNNNLFSGNRNTHALMTNFIYDFTVGWPVSPHHRLRCRRRRYHRQRDAQPVHDVAGHCSRVQDAWEHAWRPDIR